MAERYLENLDPKEVLKRNATEALDWEWNNVYMVVSNVSETFRDEVIDPLEHIDRTRMPYPVIAFGDCGNKEVLGQYLLGRNELGLKDEIKLNSVHFETKDGKKEFRWGWWSLFEIVIHEQAHLFMHHLSEIDGRKRPTHGIEFRGLLASWGIHCNSDGAHYQVADSDSPFGRVMKQIGASRPKDVPKEEITKRDYFRPTKEKGRSSLNKWICPTCELPARIGVKDDPELYHKHGEAFIKFVSGEVYKK